MWALTHVVFMPAVAILAWQWIGSYQGSNVLRGERHIAWMPFAVWRLYSSSILVSLLCSLAFPLAYGLLYHRRLQNREMLLFAWGVLGCAILWAACLAEVSTRDGRIDESFNFLWGAHLSVYLVFLATAIDLFNNDSLMLERSSEQFSEHVAKLPWWIFGACGQRRAVYRAAIAR